MNIVAYYYVLAGFNPLLSIMYISVRDGHFVLNLEDFFPLVAVCHLSHIRLKTDKRAISVNPSIIHNFDC